MFSKYDAWNAMTKNGENIVIATHYGPDGDAVGSSFALASALAILGFKPKIIMDNYSNKFNAVRGKEFIYTAQDAASLPCDVFISLDCGDFSRIAAPKELFEKASITVNIDHHISNNNFAKFNYVDVEAASTCEIVFGLINMFVPVDKYIAEAIYMGIVTDTGSFRFSATTSKTLRVVAMLMDMNINFTEIQQRVVYNKTKTEIAIFTKALQNLQYTESGIAYTTLSLQEMDDAKADFSDLDGIAEHLLNINGIKISAFFTERENSRTKVSFRSHTVDVNAVATSFGGGGHKFAAAATFDAHFSEGIAQVLDALEKVI